MPPPGTEVKLHVCLPQTFRGCPSFQRLPPSPEAKALDAPSLSTGNREGPKLRLSFSSLPIQFLIPARKGRHPQWAGLPNLEQLNQDNTCTGSNLDSTNPRRYRPVFWGILDFVKVALTHTHILTFARHTGNIQSTEKPKVYEKKGSPTTEETTVMHGGN